MNKKFTFTLIANALAYIINLAISFFLTPFIVSHVGSEAYGFTSLSDNFTTYVQVIATILNSMAGRFITISFVKKEYKETSEYFSSVFFSNVILCSILILPSIFIVGFLENIINISSNLVTDVKILFSFVFLSLFIKLLGTAFSTATFASNRKDIEAKIYIKSHIIKAIVILICFILFKPRVFFVGFAIFISTVYTFIYNIYYTKKLLPEITIKKGNINKKKIKIVLKAGIWNSFSRLGDILSNGLDLLITNLFISPTAMGVFSVAKILPSTFGAFISTISVVFTPNYTIAYAENKKDKMIHHMHNSFILLASTTNILLCLLICVGRPFFELWVPNVDSKKLFILSFVSSLYLCVEGVIQCVWNVFTITNRLKLNSIVTVATSFLNILVVFILLKTTNLGVYAVAGVSVATSILRTLLFSIPHAAKCIDIEKRFFYMPVVKSVVSLIISVIICGLICSLKPINGWIDLFLMAIPVALVSGIITICIMLKPSEIKTIINKLKAVGMKK